jgi:hypothetical protein
VTAIVAAASMALLAACSGGSSGSHVAQLGSTAPQSGSSSTRGSSAVGGSQSSQLLAFAGCMRVHGLPSFPDPAGNGKFPGAQQLRVSSAQYQAAMNACQHLLPAGANDEFPPAEVPLLLSGMRTFSQCMRRHGVPNWPDPSVDSQGRPVFKLIGISGLDEDSPRGSAAQRQCQHLLPPSLGGMPVSR